MPPVAAIAPIIAGVGAASAGIGALGTAAIVGGTAALGTKLTGGSWGDAFKSGVTSGALSFAGSTILGGLDPAIAGAESAAGGFDIPFGAAQAGIASSSSIPFGLVQGAGGFAANAMDFLGTPAGMLTGAAGSIALGGLGGGGSSTQQRSGELIEPVRLTSGFTASSDSGISQRAQEIKTTANQFLNADTPFAPPNPAEERKTSEAIKKTKAADAGENDFFRNIFATSLMKTSGKLEPSQFAMFNSSDLAFNRIMKGVSNG